MFLVVGIVAPGSAFASGDPRAVAIFIATVVVLHAASITAALLFLMEKPAMANRIGAVAAAILVAIAWHVGFLQLANNPTIQYQAAWFWIWILVPFLVLALSASRVLCRHLSRGQP